MAHLHFNAAAEFLSRISVHVILAFYALYQQQCVIVQAQEIQRCLMV